LSGPDDLRRESLLCGVETWQTSMLAATADPLGGLTYLPIDRRRLDENETLRRITRHVLSASIEGGEIGVLSELRRLASPLDKSVNETLRECEASMHELEIELTAGLGKLRAGQFNGLQELAGRVAATIERLQNNAACRDAIVPLALFLDWKLRMIPV